MQRIYFSFLCVLMVGAISAQPITSNSFEQKVAAAQEAEDAANYAGALDWYDEAYEDIRRDRKNPLKNEFAIKRARLNYILRDYKSAAKAFERLLRNDDKNNYADLRYEYGMALKASGEYAKAIEEFNKLISLSEDEDLIKKSEFEIDGIMMVKELGPNIETSIRVLGKNVNCPSGDFSPRENADGSLYFGSFARKKMIEPGQDNDDDDYHAKIFVTEKDKEGRYVKSKKLGEGINRKGFHNTHLAFSSDGKVMYFTRVGTKGTEISSSQIMVSYKKDDKWSAADLAPTVNGDWHSKHPAVGQLFGKDVLFFVSDMDGGEGDLDIFYSNINSDGSFSAPVNLGPKINTPGADESPFFSDGTLYFSTNGRPTIGGYDIFYTLWDGTEWSDPENMGLGFNSSYDDLSYSITTEGNRGFFISNRPTDKKKKIKSESCCDDIFEFQIREIVVDLLAIVVDETEAPLNGATIKLENITDPINNPTDMKYNALGNEFNFLLDSDFKYKAVITSEGFYPDSIEFNTAGILDNYTVKKKITLKAKPVVPEEPTETVEVVTINEPIRLNNIYYDFDDDKILKDSEEDLYLLKGLMDEYPTMVIELSSHTDSQGRSDYNEELSQRRANSARKWLLKKGVSKDRIKAVGYGEKIILNHCKNRVKCTDDEHRFNRRTEFKIIAGPQTIEIRKEIKK